MARFYDFASKLSGCLALVCAILAVLATPSTSRADQLTDCENCCGQMYGYGNPDYGQCVSYCMENTGPCSAFGVCPQSTCNVTCLGSFPQCGNGACNKVQACVDASCGCKMTADNKACECQAP